MKRLSRKEIITSLDTGLEVWEERPDGYRVIRLVTSWSTTREEVSRFLSALDGAS